MATRPRIFVTQPVAESALARLRAVAGVKVNTDDSRIIPKTALIAAEGPITAIDAVGSAMQQSGSKAGPAMA